MGKKMILLTICLLFMTIITGCGGNTGSGEFSNGEVSFTYPTNWKEIKYKKDADMAQYIEAFVGAPMKMGEFQPNVNLTVHSFPPEAAPDLKELIRAAEEAFTTNGSAMGIRDYSRLDYEVLLLDGIEAGLLTSEYTVAKNTTKVKTMQLIVPLKDKAYNLTATCSSSQWSEYEEIFQAIVASFSIL
ncbi:MAG: hypothetical protein GX750_03630 [Clostridia bacterium]|nr:hypothetical protein [Clostridia bacterium]